MARLNPSFAAGPEADAVVRRLGRHPLEMFPVFRRWAPGWVRDLCYTFLWNLGFAVFFTLLTVMTTWKMPTPTAFWNNLVIANCVGYTLHALFAATGSLLQERLRNAGRVTVTAYYMALSTAGVIAGFYLASAFLGRRFLPQLSDPRWIVAVAVSSLVISVVIAIVYFWRERSALAEAALAREQGRAAAIEREALAANLRALQAQIEPHFLFNTLANVTSLIEAEPARARHMLETFIRFLRASLEATRRSRTTLAEEFALIGDFLAVLEVRMGERLAVHVELPPALAAVEIPPMLVQPLVENAIRHGLEPRVEGGRIDLRAREEGGRLLLEVADTGIGFAPDAGSGVGLANIRERLRLVHGDRARVSIRENAPQGTVVVLEIPLARP